MPEENVFQRSIASVQVEIAGEDLVGLAPGSELVDLHFAAAVKVVQRARDLQVSIDCTRNGIVKLRKRLDICHIFILHMEREVDLAGLLVKVPLAQRGAGGEAKLSSAPAQGPALHRDHVGAVIEVGGKRIPVKAARRSLRSR